MRCPHSLAAGIFALVGALTSSASHAVMGGATIVDRVDKNGDKKLSLEEVRAAAARQYELIKSKNGDRVTMLQLGGRLVPADLKAVGGTPGVTTPVSKEQYLTLVDKFFEAADTRRQPGGRPGARELDINDLATPAGKKLIGLLQ